MVMLYSTVKLTLEIYIKISAITASIIGLLGENLKRIYNSKKKELDLHSA